ncbi:VOC family protein [Streptomyces uncialis]|uniref:VOC family protein n=1 Tax=Streptomyces uncialis TaxID=1048205 RepID=UPI0033F1B7C8
MNIDHMILGARDIAPLRAWLRDAHGFGITDGSPNPDGTASWVVPMDTPLVQYLELLVVHDEQVLVDSDFGRVFLDRTADGPAFLNWAALSDDIEADAARVKELTGADPELLRGESVRADGQVVPWAEAAFAASWEVPSRPFFLAYENWPARRARVPGDLAAAAHDTLPTGIASVTVVSSRADLPVWLGTDALPVTVEASAHEAVRAVEVRTDSGPRVLELP